jgi:putative peptidoglycan lipid II flippase
LAARGEHAEVAKTFAYGMRLALFVGISATALFVALAEPLVVVIFQRGAFDAEAAHETGRALMAQGLGIWAVAGVRQLVSVFYALGDTRTPVIVAALDLIVFISLALTLRGPFGHIGIGLAVAGASIAQMLFLFIGLRGRLTSLHLGEISSSALRTLLASALASAAAMFTARVVHGAVGDGAVARLFPGTLAAVVFVCVFFAGAFLFRSPELKVLSDGLLRKIRRDKAA